MNASNDLSQIIASSINNSVKMHIDKSLESISFDKTIEATIIDNTDAEHGRYIVEAENVKFVAYTSETSYDIDDIVLVMIPQGDYNNQKIILSKKSSEHETPLIYTSPFSQLIDITGNVLVNTLELNTDGIYANEGMELEYGHPWDININSFEATELYTSFKNNQNMYYICDYKIPANYSGFTRIGLSANFQTWLQANQIISGNYGLALVINYVEQSVKVESIDEETDVEENTSSYDKIYIFDSSEFYGNVYNYEIPFNQQKVFTIGDEDSLRSIGRITLFLYQRNNFADANGVIGSTYTTEAGGLGVSLANICVSEPYICFGYDASSFTGETLTLFTLNSLTYSKYLNNNQMNQSEADIIKRASDNKKQLYLRWIHQDKKTKNISALSQFPEDVSTNESYEIRWYQSSVGAPSPDQFIGAHFIYLPSEKNEGKLCIFSSELAPVPDINPKIYWKNDANIDWSWINTSDTNFIFNGFAIPFSPDINLASNTVQAIVLKKIVYDSVNEKVSYSLVATSNQLTFTNNNLVQNKADLEESNALGIRFEDAQRGTYFIYRRDNNLIDKNLSKEVRYLTAVFDSSLTKKLYEKDFLKNAKSVKWYFPKNNSLINYYNAPNSNLILDATEDEYDIYIANGPGQWHSGEDAISETEQQAFQITYTIADVFNRTSVNNTIKLEVEKDDLLYQAEAHLIFGNAGTSGSDYTLRVTWDKAVLNVSDTNPSLTGVISLHDQTGLTVPIAKDHLSLSWFVHENGFGSLTPSYLINDDDIFYPVKKVIEKTSGNKDIKALPYLEELSNESTGDIRDYYYYNLRWHKLESASYYEIPNLGQPTIQLYRRRKKIAFTCQLTYINNNIQNIRKLRITIPSLISAIQANEIAGLNVSNFIHPEYIVQWNQLSYNDVSLTEKTFFRYLTDATTDILVKCCGYEYSEDNNPFKFSNGILLTKIVSITDPQVVYDTSEERYQFDYVKQNNVTEDQLTANKAFYFIEDNFSFISQPITSCEYTENKITVYYKINEAYTYYTAQARKDVANSAQTPTLKYSEIDNNNSFTVTISNNYQRQSANIQDLNYINILQVDLNNFGDYKSLTAFFPIPVCKNFIINETTIRPKGIVGNDYVRYSTVGDIDYNSNPYKIITNNDTLFNENATIQWRLFVPYLEVSDLNTSHIDIPKFELRLGPDGVIHNYLINDTLQPLTFYLENARHYGIQCEVNGEVILTQPIFVYQDNYPSTTLNKWDGKEILTDQDGGAIVASAMAAGKKEISNGSFTGVILGDWSRTDADVSLTKQTGVFGFNNGAMSYALKDDGSAFFGKSGSGRIYLDGDKSQIYSVRWREDTTGLFLDIDDGIIKLNNNRTDGLAPHEYLRKEELAKFNGDTNYSYNVYERRLSIITSNDSGYLSASNKDAVSELVYFFRPKIENVNSMMKKTISLSDTYYRTFKIPHFVLYAADAETENNVKNKVKAEWASGIYLGCFEINGVEKRIFFNKTNSSSNEIKNVYIYAEGETWAPGKTYYYYHNNNNITSASGLHILSPMEIDRIQYNLDPYSAICQEVSLNSEASSALKLDNSGYIYIKVGSLADFKINNSETNRFYWNIFTTYIIYSNEDSLKYITLSAAETTYPLSIGSNKFPGLRPFRVDWNGKTYITDGNVSGEINANSGTLTNLKVYGTLDCSSGSIEGGSINGASITAGSLSGSVINVDAGTIGGWILAQGGLLSKDGGLTFLSTTNGITTNKITLVDKITSVGDDNATPSISSITSLGQIGLIIGATSVYSQDGTFQYTAATNLLGMRSSAYADGIVLETTKNIRLSGPGDSDGAQAAAGIFLKANKIVFTIPAKEQHGIYARFA